jgi:hypothetical protein
LHQFWLRAALSAAEERERDREKDKKKKNVSPLRLQGGKKILMHSPGSRIVKPMH